MKNRRNPNPPSGVVVYYSLKSAATQPLKLELVDGSGTVRACAASDTPVQPVDTEAINVQADWEEPAQPPSAAAGMHRFALNVATSRGGGGRGGPPPAPPNDACRSSNVVAYAPAAGRGGGRGSAGLRPGDYTVRLTVNGQTLNQPVTLKPDPRTVQSARN